MSTGAEVRARVFNRPGAGPGTGSGTGIGVGSGTGSGTGIGVGLGNRPGTGPGSGNPRGVWGPPGVMPVEKAKNFEGTFKRLWKYFNKERKLLVTVLIIVFFSNAISLLFPYIIGKTIDSMKLGLPQLKMPDSGSVISGSAMPGLLILLLAGCYLADALLNFSSGWIMAKASQNIVRNMRNALFEKLQKLPLAFFDRRTHGELMSRLTNDVDNISGTISQLMVQLISGSITVIGSFVMMLVLSPVLTLAAVITIPLVIFTTGSVSRKTRVYFKKQQATLGKLNGYIEETITGIMIVKAFSREQKTVEDFNSLNNELCETAIKAQVWSGLIMPVMNVINNLSYALLSFIGGYLALNGHITIGVISSFLIYSRQFGRPLNEIANVYNLFQAAVAGAERVFEILDQSGEADDIPDAAEIENPSGRVDFENVSFGYRDDVDIIKNITFSVPKGGSIALVGPTGAGKTTIVNLLTRFYEINAGSIRIDGTDIRDCKRNSLRKCFGIVLQDTYLFSGTIYDNIAYGKTDAGREEIEKAAIMANAHTFINKLPDGYNTVLNENGSNLSQGQRQLIAIARAILTEPCILILDEATSSVDTRTELHIQEAMLKLMEGRTTFIIAHRLSTIRDSNNILVIDKGEIAESGTHNQLIEKDGHYRRLYLSQFSKLEV